MLPIVSKINFLKNFASLLIISPYHSLSITLITHTHAHAHANTPVHALIHRHFYHPPLLLSFTPGPELPIIVSLNGRTEFVDFVIIYGLNWLVGFYFLLFYLFIFDFRLHNFSIAREIFTFSYFFVLR